MSSSKQQSTCVYVNKIATLKNLLKTKKIQFIIGVQPFTSHVYIINNVIMEVLLLCCCSCCNDGPGRGPLLLVGVRPHHIIIFLSKPACRLQKYPVLYVCV